MIGRSWVKVTSEQEHEQEPRPTEQEQEQEILSNCWVGSSIKVPPEKEQERITIGSHGSDKAWSIKVKAKMFES